MLCAYMHFLLWKQLYNCKCPYICLSLTKTPLPLRIMPICHHLHLPSICHDAHRISAIIRSIRASLSASLPYDHHAYQLSDLLLQLLSHWACFAYRVFRNAYFGKGWSQNLCRCGRWEDRSQTLWIDYQQQWNFLRWVLWPKVPILATYQCNP